MTTSLRPLPQPTELSRPFWDATREGRLVLQCCDDCANLQWTPYPACTSCRSERLTWTAVSGAGSLYSYSVVHRPQTPGFAVPYIVAIVELDEGPRMLTDLIGTTRDDVRIGMRVRVDFEPVGDLALYHFRPDETDADAGSDSAVRQ